MKSPNIGGGSCPNVSDHFHQNMRLENLKYTLNVNFDQAIRQFDEKLEMLYNSYKNGEKF